MIDNVLIAFCTFIRLMLTTFSVDEILLLRYVNMATFCSKHIYLVLSAVTQRTKPPVTRSRLCSRDLAVAGVFVRCSRSSVLSAYIVSVKYRLLAFLV